MTFVILQSILTSETAFGQSGKNDPTFATNIPIPFYVEAIAVQSDGKILIGGGPTPGKILRLNPDGSTDPTFSEGTAIGINEMIHDIKIQPDGKIIVGGSFNNFNGVSKSCLIRLNIDGTIDPSFNTGTGTDYTIHSLAIQPDGKIIIGGGFITFNGTSINQIARVNINGTIDNSFNTGTGAEGNATETWSVALQTDGKVLIGGDFLTYNGVSRNGIARLNVDGSLDNSFDIGSGVNYAVKAMAIQPDGNIILGGDFTIFNNVNCNSIVRLTPTGSLDNGFNTNTTTWPDFYTKTIAIQTDGKILIGGRAINSIGPRISRLNTDGSRDVSFNSCGIGADNDVAKIYILPVNKILVGGYFTGFNNSSKQYLTRTLNNTAPCNLEASVLLKKNGEEPSVPMEFEVALNNTNQTGADVILNYQFTGGTATMGQDYDNSITTVIIPNGQSKAIISIAVLDDNLFETAEDLEITLQSASTGVTIVTGATSKAKGTIIDNEIVIVSLLGSANAIESDPFMSFFVSLNYVNGTGADIIVNYFFSTTGPGPYATGGTSISGGADYNNLVISAAIPNGQSSATINIPIFNDNLIEGTEVIEITLTNAFTTNGTSILVNPVQIAAGDLFDDDFNIINISSTSDGKEGGNNAKYVITSSNSSSIPITVNFTYSGGTATAGSDFNNSVNSIVIPANQTMATLEIPIIDDAVSELTETLEITLTTANGSSKIATDGTQTKTAKIEDNDPDFTKVTVTSDKSELLANGIETCTITVRLFDASGSPLTNATNLVSLFTVLGSLGTIISQGNGTYTCLFTAGVISGNALITCKLNGTLVNDDETVKLIPINDYLIVNEGISPNGDGENDIWFIKGIESYPNNSVKIFNRWGSIVWLTTGYNNTSNCWRGEIKSDLSGLGSELPNGTYYYLLDMGNGKGTKSGFVILNK